MADLEVKCTRCNAKIDHVCNADLRRIFVDALRIKTGLPPLKGFKSSPYYSKGDEDAPFYSEAFLYPLLGKEEARTVLYHFHYLIKACGFDPQQLQEEADAEPR
jgi:hypothetical protein